MSRLRQYSNPQSYNEWTDAQEIKQQLTPLNILFERWDLSKLPANSSDQDVLNTYQKSVQHLKEHYGFQSADVIHMRPDHPQKKELREKFLSEHIHSDFEVRFFVQGQGLFFLHTNNQVYALLCEAGDLISVPANMPHWFDMGSQPFLSCIRLFTDESGWVAQYTKNEIANQYPTLDSFLTPAAS